MTRTYATISWILFSFFRKGMHDSQFEHPWSTILNSTSKYIAIVGEIATIIPETLYRGWRFSRGAPTIPETV